MVWSLSRSLHLSARLREEESKAERQLKLFREELEELCPSLFTSSWKWKKGSWCRHRQEQLASQRVKLVKKEAEEGEKEQINLPVKAYRGVKVQTRG